MPNTACRRLLWFCWPPVLCCLDVPPLVFWFGGPRLSSGCIYGCLIDVCKEYLPPRKVTWQWKIHHLKMYFLLNMEILHGCLSFLECILCQNLTTIYLSALSVRFHWAQLLKLILVIWVSVSSSSKRWVELGKHCSALYCEVWSPDFSIAIYQRIQCH